MYRDVEYPLWRTIGALSTSVSCWVYPELLKGVLMSHYFRAILGISLLFLAQIVSADDGYTKGLFWQIKSEKGQPSVLVGSIHLGDPKVQPQIDRSLDLLKKSQRLVLEMDVQEMQKAATLLQGGGDIAFTQVLPADLIEKTKQALLKRGISDTRFDKTPVWGAILILALPANATPGMDAQLLQAAQGAKRPVSGLESAAEQLDALRKLPLAIQQAILQSALDHQDLLTKQLQTLFSAYQAEDIQRLQDLAFESSAPDSLSAEQQAVVFDQIINQRNTRMLQRIKTHLKAGKALIAVGAMHLPGLLEGLTAEGFTVEPLEK